jgi:dTDP-4-amino-4,6-dideoxygalactose transaminase
VKVPFVDLRAQYASIKDGIDKAIQTVIDNTAFIGGEHVAEFENKFKSLIDVKHCIPVANGTDAIYITLKMLGIGQGDEVITVANSWISTSETISQTGAKPVFVDIDKYDTISVKDIESVIGPNTKAIIPVHLYGQACDMEGIISLCSKHGLKLIEDCAQSHLTEYKGQVVGTFGNAATFSFYPGKNLGAYGDAGAVITNDDNLAEKIRMYANHGALIKHHHKIEGVNSRLDGLQAAVLNVKLDHLKRWTYERNLNAQLYNKYLANIEQIETPSERNNTRHSYHLYVIKTDQRDELKSFLSNRGIQTAIHYPTPLPYLKAYEYLRVQGKDFPGSLRNSKRILSLPMYPELSEKEIKYVSSAIADFFDA